MWFNLIKIFVSELFCEWWKQWKKRQNLKFLAFYELKKNTVKILLSWRVLLRQKSLQGRLLPSQLGYIMVHRYSMALSEQLCILKISSTVRVSWMLVWFSRLGSFVVFHPKAWQASTVSCIHPSTIRHQLITSELVTPPRKCGFFSHFLSLYQLMFLHVVFVRHNGISVATALKKQRNLYLYCSWTCCYVVWPWPLISFTLLLTFARFNLFSRK